MSEEIRKLLSSIYYNTKNSALFGNVYKLYIEAKNSRQT